MSQCVQMSAEVNSLEILIEGIHALCCAFQDLRHLEEEKRMMKNCQGEKIQVDYLIKNEVGESIGIRQNQEGKVEFVLQKETETAKATINKVTQAYSRIKIINEVKKKGYKTVKEEKLANGSIRLVVEKWR